MRERGPLEDSDLESVEDRPDRRRLVVTRFLDDVRFKLGMGSVIILNVVAMLYMTDNPEEHTVRLLNHSFLVLYSIECVLRAFAFRWSFLLPRLQRNHGCFSNPMADEKELSWNRFDFCLVLFGWGDIFMDVVVKTDSPGPVMMTMRTFRLLRVVRVMRVFKVIRPLQDLVTGLLNSLLSVFWVMVLLCTVMLVFAIFTTTIFGQRASAYDKDEAEAIEEHWGNVWKSFQTLFSFLTLDDWSNMTREAAWPRPGLPLKPALATIAVLALIGYTLLTAFVILSLLTGTMVEEMENVRHENDDELLEDHNDAMRGSLNKFFDHFTAHAEYHPEAKMQALSYAGLADFLSDSACRSDLQAVGIDSKRYTAEEMYLAFDLNGDGAVGWNEVKEGLQSLIPKKVSRQLFFKLNATMKSCLTAVSEQKVKDHVVMAQADRPLEVTARKVSRHVNSIERTMGNMRNDLDLLVTTLRARLENEKPGGVRRPPAH